MIFLTEDIAFPPVENATPEGIVAVGGDLSVDRLMLAYRSGIFPWFEDDDLILWWSPPERMVLFPEKFKVSKSLRQLIKKKVFRVTVNQAFDQVITHCANIKRMGQQSTWITPEMLTAYEALHQAGHAMSVEVWQDDALVGGLYGVDLGDVFCGESMFSKVSNASKVGFAHLVERLKEKQYHIIDCQVYTAHLASLGAEEISREEFLRYLKGEDQ